MTSLAPLLQTFFTQLLQQRRVSEHTVAAYRDTFRLLLGFAKARLKKQPSKLTLTDIDAQCIIDFLAHLEQHRKNSVRTRNARLAAVHSFFRFAAFVEPAHAGLIQRVLAIPHKRFDRAMVAFLTDTELDALLAAPDRNRWVGRRDHALLLLMVQTGLRVSELIALRLQDIHLGTGAHVRCIGKGRKQRCVPLTEQTVEVLRSWLKNNDGAPASQRLFLSCRREKLSRDAVERLVSKHVCFAARHCASLRRKKISPHVLRHTSAMRLLQAGVDRAVIALWLGHESVETTQMYLHADLTIKEKALAKTAPPNTPTIRYRASDQLLAFLDAL